MPQLCFYCYQEIDPYAADATVVREAEGGTPAEYAHSACFEKAQRIPIEMDYKEDH